MATNFRVKTQVTAYAEGAQDAYALLITALEEGGINNLLEVIALNASKATVDRMDAYYANINKKFDR